MRELIQLKCQQAKLAEERIVNSRLGRLHSVEIPPPKNQEETVGSAYQIQRRNSEGRKSNTTINSNSIYRKK